MEPLTKDLLAAAERQWEAHGSDSYNLTLQVEAARMEKVVYDMVVRSGKIAAMKRNGQDIPPEHAEDYSISGLFHLLRQELRLMEKGADGTPDALAEVFARFDPQTGRLDRYRRTTIKNRFLRLQVLKYEVGATASND
ncbi:MAG: hypothetical protein HYU27_09740 [Acidobacteria bacterium]|nr:hypothetical protein [Acidobacteriota bacterium]